ncbi:hypothetical protein BG000_004976 [Podila horticola]|nr:hypothetical protein BG000_004976 [Podila horticola]
MSAPDSSVNYWKPRFKYITDVPTPVYYRNETVFVYGVFQPGHFSHFLYDGLLPLYSTMKRFQGTTSSWLLRQAEYVGENTVGQAAWKMDAITSGQELVLKSFEVVSPFQILPPKSAPICFDRAVIGLGSQCGLSYCAANTPIEVYKAYRDQIQDYYMSTTSQWHEFIDQEKRLHSTSAFSPMNCINTARYYNFQHPTSGIEAGGEPLFRQGVQDPDASDPSEPPSNSSPVVAIIERRGTRSVINLDKLIEQVVAKGFRLKVITYDQGCGIPQVAYMMRDVNILISPHGNALGGSLWMPDKPFPLVVSIDTTKYHESWFMSTTTVLAQRMIVHRCGPKHSNSLPAESTCPYVRDLDLARRYLKQLDWTLDQDTAEEDIQALTGPEYPIELFDKYGGDKLHPFLVSYWKNLSRYLDTDRLVKLLEQVRKENMQDIGKSYLQVCEEGRCCGPICEAVMSRNVVGPLSAYGQQMDGVNWGEHKFSGSNVQGGYDWVEKHPGQSLKSWDT